MCAAGLALRCHLHTCAALRGSFWKLKCDGPSPLSCSLCDSAPGSECGNITGRACSSDISNPEHLSRPPPQLCGQHPSLRNPRALLSPFPSPFHAGIALGVWTTGNASSSSILPARLPRRKQMLTKAKSMAQDSPTGLWQSQDWHPGQPGSQALSFIHTQTGIR